MSFTSNLSRRALTAGASAIASAAILGGAAFAQDATPLATPGGPSEGYNVGVYQGTCADLSGDPAYDIGDAITYGVSEGMEEEPETIGSADGVTATLLGVSNNIDVAMQDLGSEGHVIGVRDSEGFVACGQIAGVVNEGELGMAISPLDDSMVVGVAILTDTDGQTEAKVYLFDNEVSEETPNATPTS